MLCQHGKSTILAHGCNETCTSVQQLRLFSKSSYSKLTNSIIYLDTPSDYVHVGTPLRPKHSMHIWWLIHLIFVHPRLLVFPCLAGSSLWTIVELLMWWSIVQYIESLQSFGGCVTTPGAFSSQHECEFCLSYCWQQPSQVWRMRPATWESQYNS